MCSLMILSMALFCPNILNKEYIWTNHSFVVIRILLSCIEESVQLLEANVLTGMIQK